MSTLRERNNLSRRKSYENKMIQKYAFEYELYACDYHRAKTGETVWPWKYIPEGELEKAGFITDYNKTRLSRLERINDKENNMREYGLDGISLDKDGNYHGLQMKYWKSRSLTGHDLGTFFSVMFSRFWVKNKNSKGYLYHSGSLQVDVRDDIRNNPNLESIHLPYKPIKDVTDNIDEILELFLSSSGRT